MVVRLATARRRDQKFQPAGPKSKGRLKSPRTLDRAPAAVPAASRLDASTIEYMAHASLCETRADEVLSRADAWARSVAEDSSPAAVRQSAMMLRNACRRLFTPEEEREGFFLLNALKYHAAALARREALGPAGRQMLDQLLAVAAAVHEQILRANLRLALAIVRRYASDSNHFDELLSEATLVLVKAVEKFDFSRGFRFSTYATHAVQRALFRALSKQQRLSVRQHSDCQELLNSLPGRDADPSGQMQSDVIRELLPKFVAELDPRERLIIDSRYLGPESANPPTLQTLAQRMGVCKERARQLEQRAIQKLRRQFGPLLATVERD